MILVGDQAQNKGASGVFCGEPVTIMMSPVREGRGEAKGLLRGVCRQENQRLTLPIVRLHMISFDRDLSISALEGAIVIQT